MHSGAFAKYLVTVSPEAAWYVTGYNSEYLYNFLGCVKSADFQVDALAHRRGKLVHHPVWDDSGSVIDSMPVFRPCRYCDGEGVERPGECLCSPFI
jgi:hypothetical protein